MMKGNEYYFQVKEKLDIISNMLQKIMEVDIQPGIYVSVDALRRYMEEALGIHRSRQALVEFIRKKLIDGTDYSVQKGLHRIMLNTSGVVKIIAYYYFKE